LPIGRVVKPTKVRFGKGEPHETKEAAMHVTFQCGTLDFCQNFTPSEIDEMHVIVKAAFFETHMIDVRCKPVCLRCIMMCHNGKELKFKLTRTPMVGGPKLNLVLMDQMKNRKHNGRGSIGATPRNVWGG
jgi:hypothetical protein